MTTEAMRREFEALMTKHRLSRGVMYADYMSSDPEIIRPELLRFAEAVFAAGRAAAGKDTERLDWPAELTPELAEVLGWPNFRCSPVVHLFQKAGFDIKKKAEDEQAFILHWLATLVLTHGEGWRDKAAERLRELQDQVAIDAANTQKESGK